MSSQIKELQKFGIMPYKPDEDQTQQLIDMNYVFPESDQEVVWVLYSSEVPVSIELMWVDVRELDDFIATTVYVGLSAHGSISHFKAIESFTKQYWH